MSLAVRTGFSSGVMAPQLPFADWWSMALRPSCRGREDLVHHVQDECNGDGLTRNARCQGSSFLEFAGVTGVQKSRGEVAG